jgi:4-hydroxybenzoate polyprenyltransferase
VIASVAFIASAAWLNTLCFWLSPLALAIVFFYSLTKRFTRFAQIFLGLALAVSPVGAWLAVTGAWAWSPVVLAVGVLFWVAGFDLIYATQDVEIDRREGLHSMVVWLGVPGALRCAVIFHALAWGIIALFGWLAEMRIGFALGLLIMLAALIYEHREARRGSVESINRAFFHANAAVGAAFVAGIAWDVFGK